MKYVYEYCRAFQVAWARRVEKSRCSQTETTRIGTRGKQSPDTAPSKFREGAGGGLDGFSRPLALARIKRNAPTRAETNGVVPLVFSKTRRKVTRLKQTTTSVVIETRGALRVRRFGRQHDRLLNPGTIGPTPANRTALFLHRLPVFSSSNAARIASARAARSAAPRPGPTAGAKATTATPPRAARAARRGRRTRSGDASLNSKTFFRSRRDRRRRSSGGGRRRARRTSVSRLASKTTTSSDPGAARRAESRTDRARRSRTERASPDRRRLETSTTKQNARTRRFWRCARSRTPRTQHAAPLRALRSPPPASRRTRPRPSRRACVWFRRARHTRARARRRRDVPPSASDEQHADVLRAVRELGLPRAKPPS